MRKLQHLILAAGVVTLLGGCVVDRTGQSASYILQDRVEANRLRIHTMGKDLALQVNRVDDMEERAANGRQRLADSGATLENFLEELQALRGEAADLTFQLRENDGTMGAVEFRLATLEARLTHMEKEMNITPPLFLPPMPAQEKAAPATDGRQGSAARAAEERDAQSSGAVDDEADNSDQAEDLEDPEDEGNDEVASLGRPADDEVVVSSAQPSEEDVLFQQALVLMKKRDFEKAGSRLQRFIRSFPESSRAVEAQFLTGQCLFELGRYKPAINTFQKAIELNEKGTFAPKAMFMQALSFEELGTDEDIEAAKVFFAELVRIYPKSDDAKRAARKLEALGAP